MKIAYCSPLNPLKSGISDYSEEILSHLYGFHEIDLYLVQKKLSNNQIKKKFKFFSIDKLNENYGQYDLIVYHMGNNYDFHGEIYEYALKYPGIVILHDYCLQNFFLGKYYPEKNELYLDILEQHYGKDVSNEGRLSLGGLRKPIWETEEALSYPLNHEIINKSKLTLVHSHFSEHSILDSKLNKGLVDYIPFPCQDCDIPSEETKKELKNKYGISDDKIILSSFGFVSRAKRIDKILQSLNNLKKRGIENFLFLIVGEVIDESIKLEELIDNANLNDNVKIIGYTDLIAFKEYIQMSDICLNLRYPTMGESSASLFRILGYGKPVIVSNCGSFMDLPNNVSIKISTDENEVSELNDAVELLILDKKVRLEMSLNAAKYIEKEHLIKNTIKAYIKSFEEVARLDAIDYSLRKMAAIKEELFTPDYIPTSFIDAIDEIFDKTTLNEREEQ